ncbi:MAG: long-chain fatty acid--CoA ligase [Acidobacteria bacterium]|nr:MAG: long-chain fatty acid--CoA ligase [Acidobacteriota bacterium]REJ98316.1 MAG: long-chain fatty acid--CoA ligase [Acidobacteriota bacterium]REK17060.1 MAG: long-chain fatty acid--CoA ligase [Acidobacteriota bacterium]REK42970.1 MAG: long-chain fatty acid--CoA ligase [Acidobacteriota bacterium]
MITKVADQIKHKVKRIPLYSDEPQTLAELFSYALEKHPRADALNFKLDGEWVPISTAEMFQRANRIACGLRAIGIEKGDRVAILAPNSPDWTITDAACQISGVIDVPIYTTLAPASVEYIIRDSGARVLFIDSGDTLDKLRGNLARCESLDHIVVFEGSAEGAISLEELMERGTERSESDPGLIETAMSEIGKDDIATLIYTSGTTGEPKGVMLTHENLLSNVIDAGEKYGFTEEDIPLSVLPLSHVFERTGMYLYIFHGMAVHYAESIEKVPDNLQEVRPTMFVGVPRIFEKVYAKAKMKAAEKSPVKEKIFDWAIDTAKEYALTTEAGDPVPRMLGVKHSIADKLVYSKFRSFFGGRLRFCITGGAALSDTIFLIFTGSGVPILQGYGLTETSPVISSNNPIDVRLGTVGRPIRNVNVRIAGDGEIEVTGPNVMAGYYNKPEATRDTFSEDGWFKTGDIGELDDEGFLRITDRKKELFKTSGGKYIAPSPIEQMIKGSRFVSQAVLIGNGRKFAAALIVPDFEQLASHGRSKGWNDTDPAELCQLNDVIQFFSDQIDEHCEGLARFETVKRIALLSEELTVEGGELTPTLKIKRRVIDEKYSLVINRLYEEAEKESSS